MSENKASFETPTEYFASGEYGAPGTGYKALKRHKVITAEEESIVAKLAGTLRAQKAVGDQLSGPVSTPESRRPWTRKERIAVAIASVVFAASAAGLGGHLDTIVEAPGRIVERIMGDPSLGGEEPTPEQQQAPAGQEAQDAINAAILNGHNQ